MRLATYNVEWFSGLFDDHSQMLHTSDWSSRRDVTKQQQLDALGQVFSVIDADCILVVEAPDTSRSATTKKSLLNFAKHYGLRQDSVLTGFTNDTQQEIALLYDSTKISAEHDPQGGAGAIASTPRFDDLFLKDVDVDGKPEIHVFSKPPLEAKVKIKATGQIVRLIGVHIKSKAPHGALNEDDEIRISISNRRKQLAQSLWVRRRVEDHLNAHENVIVLGDFNDGPGLDEYEKLFGHSSVEIVLGTDVDPERVLFDPHASARLDRRQNWSPSTARFFLHHENRYLNALLDFIMVSHRLKSDSNNWKIWHPFDDPTCFECLDTQKALLNASDHFPVTFNL